ncbi:MAG: ribonuclease P protein component [Myxococcota bacterium]
MADRAEQTDPSVRPRGERATLPREARVRRRSVFRRVQSTGERTHTKHFLVVQAPGEAPHPRLGVTVTKKVGNAVARNRIKRLLREFFRRHRDWFAGGVDVVFIAKRGAHILSQAQLLEEMTRARRALRRAGLRSAKTKEIQ